MNWYLEVLRKYATFSGRARRQEYWMFFLVNLIINIVLSIVDRMLGLTMGSGIRLLSTLYSLFVLIPSLAVGVRRLHDTGRSGWWLLLAFIPILGWLVLLFFAVQDGERRDNQYGPDPKGSLA